MAIVTNQSDVMAKFVAKFVEACQDEGKDPTDWPNGPNNRWNCFSATNRVVRAAEAALSPVIYTHEAVSLDSVSKVRDHLSFGSGRRRPIADEGSCHDIDNPGMMINFIWSGCFVFTGKPKKNMSLLYAYFFQA